MSPLPPPLPPTRRGACPALSRPMATGDGLLVRLVPAEGGSPPPSCGASRRPPASSAMAWWR